MAEAAKKTEEENMDPNISVVDSEQEVIPDMQAEAKRRVSHVRELRERSNELFLDYAEEMYHINKNGLYHYVVHPDGDGTEKYTSFKDFVETETEYKHRTACYMVSIWEYYVEGFSRTFLEKIQHHGWTKLSRLVGIMTPDNYETKWKDELPGLSVKDLDELLKKDKKQDQIEKEPAPEDLRTDPTKRVTFQLFPQQESNLNLAFKAAKGIVDSDSKGELLDCICLDFLSTHSESFKHERPLREYFRRLEQAMSIQVIVFQDDKEGNKGIAYGEHHLDEIASSDETAGEDIEEM